MTHKTRGTAPAAQGKTVSGEPLPVEKEKSIVDTWAIMARVRGNWWNDYRRGQAESRRTIEGVTLTASA
jgi:hypothetical protein